MGIVGIKNQPLKPNAVVDGRIFVKSKLEVFNRNCSKTGEAKYKLASKQSLLRNLNIVCINLGVVELT